MIFSTIKNYLLFSAIGGTVVISSVGGSSLFKNHSSKSKKFNLSFLKNQNKLENLFFQENPNINENIYFFQNKITDKVVDLTKYEKKVFNNLNNEFPKDETTGKPTPGIHFIKKEQTQKTNQINEEINLEERQKYKFFKKENDLFELGEYQIRYFEYLKSKYFADKESIFMYDFWIEFNSENSIVKSLPENVKNKKINLKNFLFLNKNISLNNEFSGIFFQIGKLYIKNEKHESSLYLKITAESTILKFKFYISKKNNEDQILKISTDESKKEKFHLFSKKDNFSNTLQPEGKNSTTTNITIGNEIVNILYDEKDLKKNFYVLEKKEIEWDSKTFKNYQDETSLIHMPIIAKKSQEANSWYYQFKNWDGQKTPTKTTSPAISVNQRNKRATKKEEPIDFYEITTPTTNRSRQTASKKCKEGYFCPALEGNHIVKNYGIDEIYKKIILAHEYKKENLIPNYSANEDVIQNYNLMPIFQDEIQNLKPDPEKQNQNIFKTFQFRTFGHSEYKWKNISFAAENIWNADVESKTNNSYSEIDFLTIKNEEIQNFIKKPDFLKNREPALKIEIPFKTAIQDIYDSFYYDENWKIQKNINLLDIATKKKNTFFLGELDLSKIINEPIGNVQWCGKKSDLNSKLRKTELKGLIKIYLITAWNNEGDLEMKLKVNLDNFINTRNNLSTSRDLEITEAVCGYSDNVWKSTKYKIPYMSKVPTLFGLFFNKKESKMNYEMGYFETNNFSKNEKKFDSLKKENLKKLNFKKIWDFNEGERSSAQIKIKDLNKTSSVKEQKTTQEEGKESGWFSSAGNLLNNIENKKNDKQNYKYIEISKNENEFYNKLKNKTTEKTDSNDSTETKNISLKFFYSGFSEYNNFSFFTPHNKIYSHQTGWRIKKTSDSNSNILNLIDQTSDDKKYVFKDTKYDELNESTHDDFIEIDLNENFYEKLKSSTKEKPLTIAFQFIIQSDQEQKYDVIKEELADLIKYWESKNISSTNKTFLNLTAETTTEKISEITKKLQSKAGKNKGFMWILSTIEVWKENVEVESKETDTSEAETEKKNKNLEEKNEKIYFNLHNYSAAFHEEGSTSNSKNNIHESLKGDLGIEITNVVYEEKITS